MKLRAKVLVIGGGPAGAIAARFLAEYGIDVLLLERNLSFVKPCGGAVALSAFDELGIPKTTIKREVKCIRIISPKGKGLDIALKGGNLAIIERQEFDNALRRKAEEYGVKVIEGEFSRIVTGKFYEVEAKIADSKAGIVSEYIIAADGVNSRVRTALGIRPSRSFFTASEHITGSKTDLCEFWFGSFHAPLAYSWVFPATEGISIGTGCFEPGKINLFFERFKTRKGIVSNGRKRIYRIPIWKGDLYNKDNVIFIGDAAGQVMPLTYEGIYYAMKAGEFAAKAIIEKKANNYRKMWTNRFQKRFVLMEKLRNFFLKDDESAERLVALHRRPEIQEASLSLWIRKNRGTEGLLDYIRFFGKFLR